MTGGWALAAPDAVACLRDVARARPYPSAHAWHPASHLGAMAASGGGGGFPVVEGELGQAEARRVHHDASHQPLGASDGGGGLRLVACTRAGPGRCCCSGWATVRRVLAPIDTRYLTRGGNQKRLTKSAAKVVRHWLHRTLSLAYETWHEHAHAQGRMRGMLGRIAKRWRHREVAEGFLTWREQAGRQRRAGCLTARIISHWTHRTAAAAFDSWHVHAQEQRRVTMSAAKVRPGGDEQGDRGAGQGW